MCPLAADSSGVCEDRGVRASGVQNESARIGVCTMRVPRIRVYKDRDMQNKGVQNEGVQSKDVQNKGVQGSGCAE